MKIYRTARRWRSSDRVEASFRRETTSKQEYPDCKFLYQSIPKFHLAFKNWLDEAQPRLAVKLKIRGRMSSRMMWLSFENYPENIAVWIKPDEIAVGVMWQGECMDMLVCYDLSCPVKIGDQIFCAYCLPEERINYKSLKEFWVGHTFQFLADWINEKLAPAAWLGIYRPVGSKSSWAELHCQHPEPPDENCVCILPLPCGE